MAQNQSYLPKSLSACTWNANGLLNKKQELQHFITKHKIDVMLITETHLRPAHNPKLPGFTLYKQVRSTGSGGGSAIYIKNGTNHYPLPEPKTVNLETTSIIINTQRNGSIKFTAAYNRPGHQLLEADLDLVMQNHNSSILCGDLNAKNTDWNCNTTNKNGRTLIKYVENRNLAISAPNEPTHYGHHGRPDILDILIMKNCNFQPRLTVN